MLHLEPRGSNTRKNALSLYVRIALPSKGSQEKTSAFRLRLLKGVGLSIRVGGGGITGEES